MIQFDKFFHLVVLDVNDPICIFMNIYEKLKNDRKIVGEKKQEATTRALGSVIVDLPCTNMTITTGYQQIEIWTL